MPTCLIFTKYPKSHEPQRFKEEAIKKGLDVRVLPYKKTTLNIDDHEVVAYVNGERLTHPDISIIRSPGKNNQYLVTQQGIVNWLLNGTTRVMNYRSIIKHQLFDKVYQHIELSRGHIPLIKSAIYMDIELLAEDIKNYPVILKSYGGSHGDKVKKLTKPSEIFHFEKVDAPMLMQPFLTIGQDIRVIVVGDQAIGAMKRTAPEGEYLTNFSAGGEVENFDLDSDIEVRQIAERTVKHFECEYAGVDLIQDEQGRWKVLEINRYCQFRGFEQATGINVAEKVIEYLVNSSL